MATVSKTLRLSPEVVELINSFEGDNFTAKFSNMVDLVYKRRKELATEIKALQAEKNRLASEVSDFKLVIEASSRLCTKLNNISWSLNECQRMSKDVHECMARISRQKIKLPPD